MSVTLALSSMSFHSQIRAGSLNPTDLSLLARDNKLQALDLSFAHVAGTSIGASPENFASLCRARGVSLCGLSYDQNCLTDAGPSQAWLYSLVRLSEDLGAPTLRMRTPNSPLDAAGYNQLVQSVERFTALSSEWLIEGTVSNTYASTQDVRLLLSLHKECPRVRLCLSTVFLPMDDLDNALRALLPICALVSLPFTDTSDLQVQACTTLLDRVLRCGYRGPLAVQPVGEADPYDALGEMLLKLRPLSQAAA